MSQVREILEAMRRGDWDLAVPLARSLPETSLPEITTLLEGSQDPRDRSRCYAILSHWDALSYHDHNWLLKTYPDEFEGFQPHPKP